MTPLRYILDTDTVTLQQAGREPVIRRLANLSPDIVFTTVVTVREQVKGRLAAIDRANEGFELTATYDRLLATVRYFAQVNVLPFSPAAAEMLRTFRRRRIRIGTQDLRIAAIVLAEGGILITGNRRDFEQIPELLIEDWTRIE